MTTGALSFFLTGFGTEDVNVEEDIEETAFAIAVRRPPDESRINELRKLTCDRSLLASITRTA
jgi:hypothetical protein